MKPQVMLLLGVLAYALFANKASGGFSPTSAKKKPAKKSGTTNVTNIATAKAKKKKPLTAAQAKAIQEKRRAM